MKIEWTLMSALSTGLLVLSALSGADVELGNLEMGIHVDSHGVSIDIHPTFLVWTGSSLFQQVIGSGVAYGNVAVFSSIDRARITSAVGSFDPIVAHEKRHLEQYHALGMWAWPAKFVLPIEPTHRDWNDPQVELDEMWSPPSWWPNQWNFLRVCY